MLVQAVLRKDGWHGEVWDQGKRIFESVACAAKDAALRAAQEAARRWADEPRTPAKLPRRELANEC